MKKIVLAFIMSLILGAVPCYYVSAADDFTAEPIMTDVTYSDTIVGNDDYDMYKIIMPATMRLNVRVLQGAYTHVFTVYDKNYDELESDFADEGYTYYYYLKEGETYYFKVGTLATGGASNTYSIQFFYVVDMPTVTAKSSQKKKMSIKAPISNSKQIADGYEIRYRLSGKSWVTKKVETVGSLNTTISGLKCGKTYSVQVRRYVEDDNNKLYTSTWSDKVKVKIK